MSAVLQQCGGRAGHGCALYSAWRLLSGALRLRCLEAWPLCRGAHGALADGGAQRVCRARVGCGGCAQHSTPGALIQNQTPGAPRVDDAAPGSCARVARDQRRQKFTASALSRYSLISSAIEAAQDQLYGGLADHPAGAANVHEKNSAMR